MRAIPALPSPNLNNAKGRESYMNKSKKHGSFIPKLILTILILSLIAAGICIFLAVQNDNEDKYTSYQKDDTLLYTALKSAVFGQEFQLSENQINTYINDLLIPQNKNMKNCVVFFNDGIAEIYAKVTYMNNDFGLYAKADISLDTASNSFAVRLDDAKLGRLPIPDNILKTILEQNIPSDETISVKDGIIYITSSYNFNINDFILNLTFEKFDIGDHTVTCRTNSLAKNALDVLKQALMTPEGREKLKNLFHFDFSEKSIVEFGLDKLKDALSGLNDIKDRIIDKLSNVSMQNGKKSRSAF